MTKIKRKREGIFTPIRRGIHGIKQKRIALIGSEVIIYGILRPIFVHVLSERAPIIGIIMIARMLSKFMIHPTAKLEIL